MAQRNLANELETEAVDAMMAAIERRYDIAQRWYRRKAELLGLERLRPGRPVRAARRGPPVPVRGVARDRPRGVRALLAATSSSCRRRSSRSSASTPSRARASAAARSARRWPRTRTPYMLLNYTDRLRDVMTMAHELGHGMHFTLSAQRQTALSFHPGIALAEVPSTFAELRHVRPPDGDRSSDPRPARRSCRERGRVGLRDGLPPDHDGALRARTPTHARGGRPLTPDRLSEIWWSAQRAATTATRVELPEGYRLGWSYIPHFINTRFYTYAYAFAHLVDRSRSTPAGASRAPRFVPPYLGFLSQRRLRAAGRAAAGARRRHPRRRATWDRGLGEMERMLELALS